MEMSFEGLEMQKRNVPTDIIQIVDEKMGSFVQLPCLLKKISQFHLNVYPQAVTNCLLLSAERTKIVMSYILITITLEVSLIFTSFFSSTL